MNYAEMKAIECGRDIAEVVIYDLTQKRRIDLGDALWDVTRDIRERIEQAFMNGWRCGRKNLK